MEADPTAYEAGEAASVLDAAELTEHVRWARSLARRLVSDPAAAEDAVQETWLAALRRPPEPGRPVRPWIASVLKNFVRQRRRAEGARAGRERARGAREDLPSTSELLERLETRRLLLDAVRELREPYRTTILLRFFEGLSAAAIARRQKVPAATVRSRIARALEELRTALDERSSGDRSAWMPAVAALAVRPPGWVGFVSGLSGAIAMTSTTVKLGTAAAVALAAAFGWWSWEREEPASVRAEVPVASLPEEALESPTAEEQEGARDVAPEPERRSLPATEPSIAMEAAPASSDAEARAVLRLRCVDPNGMGLPDCDVSVQSGARVQTTERSVDGSIVLGLRPSNDERNVILKAAAPGRATRFLSALVESGEETHLGDVVLGPGGAVAGRVVDPDGMPVGGAVVVVTEPGTVGSPDVLERVGPSTGLGAPMNLSAADGTFRIDGAPVGFVRVWAKAVDTRHSFTAPIEIFEGRCTEGVEVLLEAYRRGDEIAGIVLSPDGEPVPRAGISYSWSSSFSSGGSFVQADAEGRFRFALLAQVPHQLTSFSAEPGWGNAILEGVEPGTTDVELRFGSRPTLVLQARDRSGRPIDAYSVQVLSAETGEFVHTLQEAPRDEGRATVTAPTQPFVLQVDAPGFSLGKAGPFDPDSLPSEVGLELEPLPCVRGRVMFGGEPVAGAKVELRGTLPASSLAIVNGFRSRLEGWPTAATRTEDDGTFLLTLRKSGSFSLLVHADGFAPAELAELELDHRLGAQDLVVALGRGGAIEGRVLVPPSAEPAGTIVGFSRGDGNGRTVRVGVDGTYRVEGLTPGPWQVVRTDVEVGPYTRSSSYTSGKNVEPIVWDCEVYEGETTYFDLDLRDREPCILVGTFTVNGEAPAEWTARVQALDPRATTRESESTGLSGDGSFELHVEEPGPYRLVLAFLGDDGELGIETEVRLERGTEAWQLDLPAGSLEGTVLLPEMEGTSVLLYLWGKENVHYRAELVPDAEGRVRLPLVPAGPGLLKHFARPASSDEELTMETLLEVDVRPGETARVSWP